MSSVDLTQGISIQVEGEAGKYHTLRVEDLIEIARNVEKLVQAIAKSDIDTGDAIDLDNFRVELAGFSKGSAVTTWVQTPRVQLPMADLDKQRAVVNQRLEKILRVADTGHYGGLRDLYPDALRRNEIVGAVFALRNSVPDAPMAVVKQQRSGKPKKLFALKPFKRELRDSLTTKVISGKQEGEEKIAIARVRLVTDPRGHVLSRKTLDLYKQDKSAVAWAPEVIVHDSRAYILRFPLMCAVEHEGKVYSIENRMLGIMGTGVDMDEAEATFSEEFDFLYRRYANMSDKKLAPHLVEVKRFLKHLVTEVEG